MSKTVGIITYHGLHNYGAMLQAFALQTVVKNLGFSCEIINFRTEVQKRRYLPVFKIGKSLPERLMKQIFLSPYKSDIFIKHRKFEKFLETVLKLSPKEYTTLDELFESPPGYDYYISGSDQIWNPGSPSFEWAYYLPFVKKGKRIAYAPSMVQKTAEELDVIEKQRIKEYIEKYDNVSVREEDSASNINIITGNKPQIVLDPTMLLEIEQWEPYIGNTPIIEGEYLFYYTPNNNSYALNIARQLAKKLNLKIVTSIVHSATFVLKYPDFKKEVAVGPLEFLNLCKNAKLICGHSLHLVAFSIVFNKPFFITEGMANKRTKHLLKLTNLTNRSISAEDINEKVKNTYDIDYIAVNRILKAERENSLNYLIKALK